MIHGIIMDVKGEELIECINARVVHHRERAKDRESAASGAKQPASDTLERKTRQHQERAEALIFLGKHIVRDEELRTELEAAFARNLEAFPTRDEINKRFDELRTHFDVVAESFRSQFGNLYDWVEANTSGLATRVEQLEHGHGARLLSLEGRVTHLENRPK